MKLLRHTPDGSARRRWRRYRRGIRWAPVDLGVDDRQIIEGEGEESNIATSANDLLAKVLHRIIFDRSHQRTVGRECLCFRGQPHVGHGQLLAIVSSCAHRIASQHDRKPSTKTYSPERSHDSSLSSCRAGPKNQSGSRRASRCESRYADSAQGVRVTTPDTTYASLMLRRGMPITHVSSIQVAVDLDGSGPG